MLKYARGTIFFMCFAISQFNELQTSLCFWDGARKAHSLYFIDTNQVDYPSHLGQGKQPLMFIKFQSTMKN